MQPMPQQSQQLPPQYAAQPMGVPGLPGAYTQYPPQSPPQQYYGGMQAAPGAGAGQGQAQEEHGFSDQVSLAGASVWDPTQQEIPEGVYPVRTVNFFKRPGQKNPQSKNYWWECKILSGEYAGRSLRINVGCDLTQYYNSNKLFTAALSHGYTPQEISSDQFRISEQTFVNRNAFVHVQAPEEDDQAPAAAAMPGIMFDPATQKKRKPMSNRCFITKEIYDRELAAASMLGRDSNGKPAQAQAQAQVPQQAQAQVAPQAQMQMQQMPQGFVPQAPQPGQALPSSLQGLV